MLNPDWMVPLAASNTASDGERVSGIILPSDNKEEADFEGILMDCVQPKTFVEQFFCSHYLQRHCVGEENVWMWGSGRWEDGGCITRVWVGGCRECAMEFHDALCCG